MRIKLEVEVVVVIWQRCHQRCGGKIRLKSGSGASWIWKTWQSGHFFKTWQSGHFFVPVDAQSYIIARKCLEQVKVEELPIAIFEQQSHSHCH